MREGLDDLDAALDQHVGPAAVIAGNAADQDAEGKADRNPDQPDGQRNAGAVDDAREHVAPEPVGPEQEQLTAVSGAEQVEIACEQTPIEIAVAVAEEADWLTLLRVGGVDAAQIRHVEAVVEAVDKRPGKPAVVENVHGLR